MNITDLNSRFYIAQEKIVFILPSFFLFSLEIDAQKKKKKKLSEYQQTTNHIFVSLLITCL